MPAPKLWRRVFTRDESLDQDLPADDDFRKKHFLDYFGRVFLEQHWNKLTYNGVITEFFKFSHVKTKRDPEDYERKFKFEIFCAADGPKAVSTKDSQEKLLWLNYHVRFVAVVSGREVDDKVVADSPFSTSPGAFTLFIVGSESPESTERFMDATCWDGTMFRFYARDWMQEPDKPRKEWQGGWVYQGASVDAFSTNAYLGPFGGHVNGSLVMKELHRPWPHWHSGEFQICDRFPQWIKDAFAPERTPWISDTISFDQVSGANQLELRIRGGIGAWLTSRAEMDFRDGEEPRKMISGMKRWIAHILLTTSVNIAVAERFNERFKIPENFAYCSELANLTTPISDWFPKPFPKMFQLETDTVYRQAIADLQIAIYHVLNGPPPTNDPVITMHAGDLGGGKDGLHITEAIRIMLGEGQSGIFTMMQHSFEDAKAVEILMDQEPEVVSRNMFVALMMIDACNPIFSWRRGVLLQYIPDKANFIGTPARSDLEAQFVQNIKASPRFINDKDKTSPETEFIINLESLANPVNEKSVKEAFHAKMTSYWKKVHERLQTKEGITDYLRLVQSKHRVYRPVPLNEFALTLPYMPNWTEKLPLEMTYEGKVQPMSNRGSKFLLQWLSTLMGSNPNLIPRPDANDTDDDVDWTLAGHADARSMTVNEKELVPCRRRQACPVLRQNLKAGQDISVSVIGQTFLTMMTRAAKAAQLAPSESLEIHPRPESVEVKA